MNDHTATATSEPPIDRDVDDSWHCVGKVVDRQRGGMGGHCPASDPQDRCHHIFKAVTGIVAKSVDPSVDTLEIARTEMMGEIPAIHSRFLGLARGEVAELGIGDGYASGQEAVCHFGLGDVKKVDVEVRLPGGKRVIRKMNLAVDQTLVVKEP